MINNTIHQVNFSVRKYGTANEVLNKKQNVFEDNVFDVNVFEFGKSISQSAFDNFVFDPTVFFQDYN